MSVILVCSMCKVSYRIHTLMQCTYVRMYTFIYMLSKLWLIDTRRKPCFQTHACMYIWYLCIYAYMCLYVCIIIVREHVNIGEEDAEVTWPWPCAAWAARSVRVGSGSKRSRSRPASRCPAVREPRSPSGYPPPDDRQKYIQTEYLAMKRRVKRWMDVCVSGGRQCQCQNLETLFSEMLRYLLFDSSAFILLIYLFLNLLLLWLWRRFCWGGT